MSDSMKTSKKKKIIFAGRVEGREDVGEFVINEIGKLEEYKKYKKKNFFF